MGIREVLGWLKRENASQLENGISVGQSQRTGTKMGQEQVAGPVGLNDEQHLHRLTLVSVVLTRDGATGATVQDEHKVLVSKLFCVAMLPWSGHPSWGGRVAKRYLVPHSLAAVRPAFASTPTYYALQIHCH